MLTVTPSRPALDTELHLRATGLRPGATARIDARQRDPFGRSWRSSATFTTDTDGILRANVMGLVEFMHRSDEPVTEAPDVLTLTLGDTETSVARQRCPDGVRMTDVRESGLVGVLCEPERPGPSVILLGGAEGGLHADDAALLAAHGFTVLALASWGMDGVPPTAMDIPLEYFETAIEHVDAVAVVGGSKGGETALLLAATFPRIRAAVSVCGSGVVTQGLGPYQSFLEIVGTPVPHWTYHGEPLPYLPNIVTPELEARVAAGEPIRLKSVFTPGLRHESLAAATIPLERSDAEILLISSSDDAGYGVEFHEIAAKRRPVQHVVHQGAGHDIIAPPYAPTTETTSPGPGVTFEHGGTPVANAVARACAWRDTVNFLAGCDLGAR